MGFNFNSLLDILYPPLCLHCDAYLEKGKKLFCSLCLEQLTLLDPSDHCPTCFAEKPPAKKCARCCARPSLVRRQAACCAPFGPAQTLSACLKKGHEERVSAVFSLIALQWAQLSWPLHDCVTAVPISTLTRLRRGCDINALLAKQMARHSERPYVPLLKAHFDKEAFLTKGEFTTCYSLRDKNACDQRLLVIALELDDLAFRAAATQLRNGGAKEIYTLGFVDSFPIDDVEDADDRHALVDAE